MQTITQIQEKIELAEANNDTVAVSFWYGRLSYISLIFEPIPEDTYDTKQNSTNKLMNANEMLKQWDETGEEEVYYPTEPYPRNMFLNIISATKGFMYAAFVN